MRTRSVFLLVWTHQSENTREHTYRGMTFRNHRLAYWLEYVRHLSGLESPVIIVQNMCDQPADKARYSPVEDKALRTFAFTRSCTTAPSTTGASRRSPTCSASGPVAAGTFGRAKIGKGRLAVKRKLESLRDEDASLPAGERKYRTLTQEFFHQLCTETGGVRARRSCSIIFIMRGSCSTSRGCSTTASSSIKNGRCKRFMPSFSGRSAIASYAMPTVALHRSLLEALVWSEYSVEEQELFLSLMTSCGVCFVHRQGDRRARSRRNTSPPICCRPRGSGDGYRSDVGGQAPRGELVVELPFLHPGVMRGIISRIGQEAGISALYWKYGVCLYEGTTRSRALIEQRASESPTTWSGQILVSTRGGQARSCSERLKEWIKEELDTIRMPGLRKIMEPSADPPRSATARRKPVDPAP